MCSYLGPISDSRYRTQSVDQHNLCAYLWIDTFACVTHSEFLSYFGLCFVLALTGAKLTTSAATQVSEDDFHDAVAHAAKLSTLAESGAPPFHLKLTAQDSAMRNPEYNAEIEVWW